MSHPRGLLAKLHDFIVEKFPERQVFIRAEGTVHFKTLTRARQLWLVGGMLALFGWVIVATALFVASDIRLTSMERDVERVNRDRDLALQRVQETVRDLLVSSVVPSGARAQIEARRREDATGLDTLATVSTDMRQRLTGLTTELDRARAEQWRLHAAQESLGREREGLKAALANASRQSQTIQERMAKLSRDLEDERADKSRVVAARDELLRERDELAHERDALRADSAGLGRRAEALQDRLSGIQDRTVSLETDLQTARLDERRLAAAREGLMDENGAYKRWLVDLGWQNYSLHQQQMTLTERLSQLEEARQKVELDRASLESRIADLTAHLQGAQEAQKALLARISSQTSTASLAVERAIAMTGLDADKLLHALDLKRDVATAELRPAAAGAGGPFVAFKSELAEQPGQSAFRVELDRMVSSLDQQNERRADLERVLAHLPLGAPIDDYQVMSPFGFRMDPINGKLGYHTGIDLVGASDATVLATGPGTVVFAARNGGYGNMVEIDHGMGVHTRYAHLSRILVKVGQKVPLRAAVGIVGTTGRSTGTHVHYEVVVEDQPNDPAKFLRAGHYVLNKE